MTVPRVLPPARPRWHRGLVRPRCVHLAETEDGQPRTVAVGPHLAGVAPCRAMLIGRALPDPFALDAEVCPVCWEVFQDVYAGPRRLTS